MNQEKSNAPLTMHIFLLFIILIGLTSGCSEIRTASPIADADTDTDTYLIRKVLIIGIDGCRPDAIPASETPNMDIMISEGTYSYDALTVMPSVSGPCWSSMLTGVAPAKHGITNNSFNGSNYEEYPDFFERIETYNPDMVTESIVNWAPINDVILGGSADYVFGNGSDEQVKDKVVERLTGSDPDILFLQFDELDGVGHRYGFGPDVPQYTAEIKVIDGYIGEIVTAVKNRPTYDEEDWVYIVTTDHGGIGKGHGGSTLEERNVFLIVSGDSIPHEEIVRTEFFGTVSTGVVLNGIDEYLTVPDVDAFDFGSTRDFSIEVWVKTNGWSGDPVIVSDKNWNNGSKKGFVLAAQSNGKSWKVNLGDDYDRADLDGGYIADNVWHHLAVTFDRDGEMVLYHDGDRIDSIDISVIGDVDSSLPIVLGQDGTTKYKDIFPGSVAELRIWNAALEADVIMAHAAERISNSHPQYSQLIGYWKMDEGVGTNIADSSTGANQISYNGTGLTWEAAAGELHILSFANTPRVYDVPVTAMEHLCVPIDDAWYLDGSAIGVICE